MYSRLFKPSQRSYFLLGPRGTGKTTWLREHYKKASFYDLLNPSIYLKLQRQPERFRQEVNALSKEAIIVIDEVQKLPILLDDVHHFLAQRTNNRQFILSGSSARKLKRSSVNLLAGRASQRFFYPLVQVEHQMDQLNDLFCFGTLPETLNLKEKSQKIEFLESYALTYLREEIQQEAVVKNINRFSNFLDVAALCNAQVINVSSLARDSGVARTTITGYFQALEDTLIGSWVFCLKSKDRVKTIHHPKFFFFDTGIVRALMGRIRDPVSSAEKGHLLETVFLNELKVWNQFHNWGAKISFWKTHYGSEIDFIIKIKDKKIGLELKSSRLWKKEFGKHIKKAKEQKIIHRGIGIYLGDENLKEDDLEIYSFKNFLNLLSQNTLI